MSINTRTILGLYALSPAYDSGFDPRARYSILPITATPSTQEWDNIRPDVILAKDLEQLVRWRFPFMNEGIDALLPCRHPFFRSSNDLSLSGALSRARVRCRRFSPRQTHSVTNAWFHRPFCCRIDVCSSPEWRVCPTFPQ